MVPRPFVYSPQATRPALFTLCVMLAPGIPYLLQLAVLRRLVILADVADRSAWIEVTTAYRALDAVLHGPPQINAMDLPFVFWRPVQVTPISLLGLLCQVR